MLGALVSMLKWMAKHLRRSGSDMANFQERVLVRKWYRGHRLLVKLAREWGRIKQARLELELQR